MDELIIKKQDEISEAAGSERQIKFVKLDLTETDKARVNSVLSEFVQCIQLGKNLKDTLVVEEKYILDIPKYIQKGLKSGKYWLNKKVDSGKMLASVSHKVGNRKEFLQNLTVKKERFTNDNALSGASDGMYRMVMQQQIVAMAMELQEVHNIVKKIEVGQTDDRFAEIDGAKLQLELASKALKRENQIAYINGAMPLLTAGSEKIKKALMRKINEFEEIPASKLQIYKKMFFSPGNYKNKKDNEVDNINEYFCFFAMSQKLMACASLMLYEPEAMLEIFRHQEEFLDSMDAKKIRTICNLHPELDFSEEWYSDPSRFIEVIKNQYIEYANKKYDYISLEVTGNQLLEALGYDKT
ncbi:MAG TPA: hypothetical protein VIK78_01180 [Ruminiclostridium sp.]